MKHRALSAILTGDYAILRLHKNASRSMIKFANDHGLGLTYELDDLSIPIIAFIREPVDRFYCAAEYFAAQQFPPFNKDGTTSYRNFVDYALTHNNLHWARQVDMVEGLPNLYFFRFDELALVWENILNLPSLPKVNETDVSSLGSHQRVERDYRLEEIKEKYKADTFLYNHIVRFNDVAF